MGDNKLKEYLKRRRLELGLSMRDVAEFVGVNDSTIMRWESGEINDMRRDKINAYAKALRISPAIIMGWEEVPEGIMVELTNYEEELLDKFRALPKNRQHDVGRIINMYYDEVTS